MKSPLALSPEQGLAAQAPLGDVCVMAGAGSGKTRVLVARFVEHLRAHQVPARRVAALTFTEKAARQLRQRVHEAVMLAGDRAEVDEVRQAPISTLHAFCARLLRRNAVAAGLDPAFRVLDETEQLLLQEDALELASARLDARPDAEVLVRALRRVSETDALGAAQRLLVRLGGAGGAPESLRWHAGPLSVPQAAADVVRACEALEEALDLLPDPPPTAGAALARVRSAAAGDLDPRAAWDEVAALTIGGKGSRPATSARTQVREALAALRCTRLDEEGPAWLGAIRPVLVELGRAYVELKRRAEGLDFDDLEQATRALLDALQRRGARLEGAPRVLLVDEHQDTNPVQESILAHLRAQEVTQFSVGDPKQSIYRFRRADVGVLLHERERVGPRGRRDLEESYRATPELVAALNGLNARLFQHGAAGVPFAALRSAGEFAPAAAGEPPAMALHLLEGADLGAGERHRREAAYVAAWLHTVVGRVERRHAQQRRLLRWGDCAILLRARTDMRLIEEALTEAGIPFRVRGGRGYRAADEIESLVHALRVVHNPRDEFALACLLRGPALAAGDDDLLGWFGQGVPAWERLTADPRGTVRDLVRTLTELQERAAQGDLARLVAASAERLGLLAGALAQPDGARRAANVRRAVALAHDLSAAGRHDLASFLRHLETLDKLDVEQAEAPAVGEDGDALTLGTIHGAKGLEWPVVVLPDLGRRGAHEAQPWYLDPSHAIAAKLRDPLDGELGKPGGYTALQEREGRAGAEELRRLFYVATTRAEQHLLLTLTYPSIGSSTGRPRHCEGLGRLLCEQIVPDFGHGSREIDLDGGRLHLTVAILPEPPEPRAAPEPDATPVPGVRAQAEQALVRAAEPLPTLKGTRYVVSVSELLTFARSPSELYEQRLEAPPLALPEARPPASGSRAHAAPAEPREVEDPEARAAAAAARRAEWDEPSPEAQARREERIALGRAVHAAIERWTQGQGLAGAGPEGRGLDTDGALAAELGHAASASLRALARAMGERFLASRVAQDLGAALASGGDARWEVSFHARIRFPAGKPVAGLEGLLVRGSIDLWLPRAGGVWIVDHKTNAPSRTQPTPESLAASYGPQLRLYALAAERLLGRDVAGAALLLLDPGWGPAALEVPVDVGGEALEETRRLCQAFAQAEYEDRWPADWRELLESGKE